MVALSVYLVSAMWTPRSAHFAHKGLTVILFCVGLWTKMRDGSGSGNAAMKVNLLIGLPVIVLGLLAGMGAVRLVLLGSDTVDTGPDWRISLAFYGSTNARVSQLKGQMIFAPLFAIVPAYVLGCCGGLVGRLLKAGYDKQAR